LVVPYEEKRRLFRRFCRRALSSDKLVIWVGSFRVGLGLAVGAAGLHFVPEQAKRIALTRAVNSQRTFLLELQIEPRASTNQIEEYWRLPSARRQFRPMLESLAERPTGSRIDVVHLMPPLVREYVYLYPVST
jgi:hypothetical protein